MRIHLILFLNILIQLSAKNLVGDATENVTIEAKTSEESEREEKVKEEEEDSCLSSPCGTDARCKNVQV